MDHPQPQLCIPRVECITWASRGCRMLRARGLPVGWTLRQLQRALIKPAFCKEADVLHSLRRRIQWRRSRLAGKWARGNA